MQSLEITAAADPARHAWNVLADFVDSLTGVEARRAVQKLVNWDRKLQVHALLAAHCRAADFPCYTRICLMPSTCHIPLQDEDEMAAASLELDGMAAPAQVFTHLASDAAVSLPIVDGFVHSCSDAYAYAAAGQLLAARAAHAGAQPVL